MEILTKFIELNGMSLIMSLIASWAYAIYFNLRRDLCFTAAIGGMLSWLGYLVADVYFNNAFVITLIGAAVGALYSEILARVRKVPSTLYFLIAMIPTIPGGSLYMAMESMVQGSWALTKFYITNTLLAAIGIGAGMAFGCTVTDIQRKVKKRLSPNNKSGN